MFQYGYKVIHRRSPISGPDEDDSKTLSQNYSPLLTRIFRNRGVYDSSELDYSLSKLEKPHTLKDGETSAEILVSAIKGTKRVLIIGDYDTDGATAVTLAVLGLKSLGLEKTEYLVPNRFEFGYGLSLEIAKVALKSSPEIVITVDNGINSIEGVEFLKSHGIIVIITDHHLSGPSLPAADAILNPNQPGCEFPSKAIAGVGVMFYLLLLVRARLKSMGWYDSSRTAPNLGTFIDLVALGTIADVVPLDYNNRILVANGLERIRKGKCRPGILALIEVGNKHYKEIVSSDFGFVLAPRLNAAGRLDDISTGIECLLANDGATARLFAQQLNEINEERKVIEGQMQKQAMDIVKDAQLNTEEAGHCLYDPDWHQGITGLVAARVKDKTNQPVIAFAKIQSGQLTGSARSITGLHIKDLLEKVSMENTNLIEKFGGHAMAAGLTIQPENYESFCTVFYEQVKNHYQEFGVRNTIDSDGELEQHEINLENAEKIRLAAPWGQGFLSPKFDGEFIVKDYKVVGEIHLKMTLQLTDLSAQYPRYCFQSD